LGERLEDLGGQVANDRDGNAVAGDVIGIVVTRRKLVGLRQAHQPCGLAGR
jgi:hypothetical protein